MSLFKQLSRFSSNSRSLNLEADPCIMEALEKIAIVLGAEQDEENPHIFHFVHKEEKKNIQSLDAIEIIFDEIPKVYAKKVIMSYKDEFLVLEGDTPSFKAFAALLRVFEKDISCKIIFSDTEQNKFFAAYNVAEQLGLLPKA